MSARTASAIATGLAAAALTLVGASLFGVGLGDSTLIDADVLFVPAIASLSIVGALIARSQPHNPIGWLFIVMALMGSLGK